MKGTVSVTELVQRDRIRDAQIALMKRGLSSTTISWDLSFEDGPISVERLLFDLANAMEKFLGEKPQSAVTRIEPFDDPKPRDESFPAPSHRPRYIPFL